MPITALPTPPSRNDPTNFATRADAFLGALPTFATEANALASDVNADEAAAAASAAAAAQSAIDATNNGAAQVALAEAQVALAEDQVAIATTQAGIATTKASEASASADAAAASAANIELGEKLNLGAKASNPTVDNQGDPLTPGAIYYNTTAEETRQWTGTVWTATGSSVNGTASRQTYTATAGQTTFSITYDVGYIDVYLNGVKQVDGTDFTATNGTSVVFASGLTAGDVVDMVAYGVFSIASEALNVQVVSSNTNALAYRVYVLTASLTLTLPESPAPGQYVRISNASGTTTCVVARNGSNIMSLAEDLTLDAINASLTLMYADATRGWVFI